MNCSQLTKRGDFMNLGLASVYQAENNGIDDFACANQSSFNSFEGVKSVGSKMLSLAAAFLIVPYATGVTKSLPDSLQPTFSSAQFDNSANRWGVLHTTQSHHIQSIGDVDRLAKDMDDFWDSIDDGSIFDDKSMAWAQSVVANG